MKLSACVIVKNEEKNIENWLLQMKRLSDEMIVVDTGSVDQTVEIARAHGAKVYLHAWQNDFSEAKNYAIDKATGDWILFLDADEFFTEAAVKNLHAVMERFHRRREVEAMVCKIINIDVDQRNKTISAFSSVRIFRNKPYLRYHGKIHEILENSQKRLGLASLENVLEIYHTGYSSEIYQRKLRRNLNLLLKDMEDNGERPELYHYLCDCYHALQEADQAVKYAEKHIHSGYSYVGGDHEVYKKWIDGLIQSGRDLESIFAAIALAQKKFPQEPTFPFCKGEILLQLNRNEEAQAALLEAQALDQEANRTKAVAYASDMFISFRPELFYCLGAVKERQSDVGEALQYYLKSLQLYRYQEKVFLAFYRLLSNQEPIEIIACINAIYNIEQVEDLQFLLEALHRTCPSKVELYYQKQALKKGVEFPQKLARSFWAIGKQEKAVESMTNDLDGIYMDLIVAAIALYGNQAPAHIASLLPESYLAALKACVKLPVRTELDRPVEKIYQEITERLNAFQVRI